MVRQSVAGIMATLLVLLVSEAAGQDLTDEATAKAIADRLILGLERNPRRGPTFDRIYAYHTENGTLSDCLARYQEQGRRTKGTESAGAWMIVGLIQSRRGIEGEAAQAFSEAEKLDPINPVASFYLGQSLLNLGQSDSAVLAFERAIQRKPAPVDVIDIYQALGRLYQRTQKSNQALNIWTRLEQQFPQDLHVQEQIAQVLLEENDLSGALARFERLSAMAHDIHQRSKHQVEVADLKGRLGKPEDAIKDFEAIYRQLNPDHWLARDVRRRIETLLARGKDPSVLIRYYQNWLQQNPDDLDAMSRLAQNFHKMGQTRSAMAWVEQGLSRAPSHKGLRYAAINYLIGESKYSEAIGHYQALDRYDPANPDTLREWGRTILKDSTRELSERQQAALRIWQKLTALRPMDPHLMSQVAELCRQAEMADEAISFYRRAAELDPLAAHYHEYLGDYFQSLKRPQEALAAWQDMATGPRLNTTNLGRLADVLSRSGFLDLAIDANARACALDPRDFATRLKQVDLLASARKQDAAMAQLALTRDLATTDQEREAILIRELDGLRSLDQLNARILSARKDAAADSPLPTEIRAERWYWLARAYESEGHTREALQAISQAAALSPESIPILSSAARIHEVQKQLQIAARFYRKLAAIHRQSRTEYLKRLIALEEQLGQRERALEAARELLDSAPGNSEICDMVAKVFFRQRQSNEGINVLRRCLRANPHNIPSMMNLAEALRENGRDIEAMDVFWQAFERSKTLNERLTAVHHLTQISVTRRSLRPLYDRLIQAARNPADRRDMTLCLAKAYQESGDSGAARRTLQTLLSDDISDSDLLAQLRMLAEHEGDLASATQFQRQIWKITSDKSDRNYLAQLLMKSGFDQEAIELLTTQENQRVLTDEALKLIDQLMVRNQLAELLVRLKHLRQKFPGNWELLYREGVALARSDPKTAIKRFEELLDLKIDDDQPSLIANSSKPSSSPSSTSSSSSSPSSSSSSLPLPVYHRLWKHPEVHESVLKLLRRNKTPSRDPRNLLFAAMQPQDYGSARIAAWCWLTNLQPGPQPDIDSRLSRSDPAFVRRTLIDRIVTSRNLNKPRAAFEAARELLQISGDDVEAKVILIYCAVIRTAKVALDGDERRPANDDCALTVTELDDIAGLLKDIGARPDLIPVNHDLLQSLQNSFDQADRQTQFMDLLSNSVAGLTSEDDLASLMIRFHSSMNLAITAQVLDRLIAIQNPDRIGLLMQSNSAPHFRLTSPDQLSYFLLPILQRPGKLEEQVEVWNRYLQIYARDTAGRLAHGNERLPSDDTALGKRRTISEMPSLVLSNDATKLLECVRRHFGEESRQEELPGILIKHLQTVELSEEEQLHWRHAIAYAQWMNDNQAQALENLAIAARSRPMREELAWGLIKQYELASRPADALELLDQIRPPADSDLKTDTIRLRLAINAGLIDRATSQARKMAGSATLPNLDLFLAQLLQLKMNDLAVEVLGRAGQQQELGLEQLRTLMKLQSESGRGAEAADTAIRILAYVDRLVSARISHPARQQAYAVLSDTGRLQAVIQATETQLVATPESEALLNKLMACHAAAGNLPAYDNTVDRRLNLKTSQLSDRFATILGYVEAGRVDPALKHLTIIARREPDDLAKCVSEMLNRYGERKELADAARLLGQLDWWSSDRLASKLPEIILLLHARPASAEIGDALFQKLWLHRPEHRFQWLEFFSDDYWWKLPSVIHDLPSVVIPHSKDDVDNQWKVFGRTLRNEDPTPRLMTVWNRLLDELSARHSLDTLTREVDVGLTRWPTWSAGKLMLAMIDLRRGKGEEGRQSLERLIPELQGPMTEIKLMAWEIAQEAARDRSGMDLARQYFDVAIRHSGPPDWTLTSSPARALVDSYMSHQRSSDALKVLLENIPLACRRNAPLESAATPEEMRQLDSIGQKLRSLGFTIEAIETCLDASSEHGRLERSSSDLQGQLLSLFGELKPESLAGYLERLDGTIRPVSLPLFVTQKGTSQGRLQCRWHTLLPGVANSPELSARVRAALDRLLQIDQNDLALRILSAQLHFAANDFENGVHSANRLAEMLEQVEKNTESKPFAGPLRNFTRSDQMALWLIARVCLEQPGSTHVGLRLGKRALLASGDPGNRKFSNAIRSEWERLAEDSSDPQTRDLLKQELSEIMRTRPGQFD